MSDRVLMKTEKASSLSSTFGVTEQCAHTHTHTHTQQPSPCLFLGIIPWSALRPPPPNNGNGLLRRTAEAATTRGDPAKLPPGLRRGRHGSCPASEEGPMGRQ